eukprot:COSAG01_NODE_4600_length_4887_cov_2.583542_3_plen_74_part_00
MALVEKMVMRPALRYFSAKASRSSSWSMLLRRAAGTLPDGDLCDEDGDLCGASPIARSSSRSTSRRTCAAATC